MRNLGPFDPCQKRRSTTKLIKLPCPVWMMFTCNLVCCPDCITTALSHDGQSFTDMGWPLKRSSTTEIDEPIELISFVPSQPFDKMRKNRSVGSVVLRQFSRPQERCLRAEAHGNLPDFRIIRRNNDTTNLRAGKPALDCSTQKRFPIKQGQILPRNPLRSAASGNYSHYGGRRRFCKHFTTHGGPEQRLLARTTQKHPGLCPEPQNP